MNKKLTALTALLLTALLLTSMLGAALADTTASLTKDDYSQALETMQDDLSLIPTDVPEGVASQVTVTGTTLVPVAAPVEGGVSVNGSIELTNAETSAAAYQWQINVDGVWANIMDANADSLTLTYAMAIGALNADGNVELRRLHYDADGTLLETCDEFTVPVSTEVSYEEQPTESTLDVTQYTENETPDAQYDAAWAFQNAANGRASTYALTPAAEEPELSSYSVVINYVFENNGGIVADPYTAVLAAGSDFKTTVTFPVVQGYLAYINETELSTQLELNITDIQKDVTYTVTYKPTNVNYTVIHYLQNVDNDNYTIDDTETKQGLTGSTVPEVVKTTYEGFYALLYERPEIAADGSTVVEVRYDRNYYLMLFDLGGGYGVEPIYARYGATIGDVGTPTRAGYTFQSWTLNGETAEIPDTMPAEKRTYVAQWQMNDTAKVSVVLWGQNANDNEYSYLGTGQLELTPGEEYTYKDGTQLYLYCDLDEHNHVTDGCELTCGKEEHTTHTEECIICDITSHSHNVTCWSEDGAAFSKSGREHYVKGTKSNGYIGESYFSYVFDERATGNKYIYIDGTWYKYTGTASVGSVVNPSCGLEEVTHNHTDACYGCETHTHTSACYSCGKEEHAHSSACTGTVDGLDSTLWTFNATKSDKNITVNPDGSTVINVYYDRTTFTLTFKERSSSSSAIKTITKKWGADIHTEFPINDSNGNTILWTVPSGCETFESGTYLASINTMPPENITFTKDGTGSAAIIYYYVEALPGVTTDVSHTYNGTTKYFNLYKQVKYTKNGYLTYAEEFHDIQGFKQWDSDPKFSSFDKDGKTSTINNENYLYYTRSSYAIEYYNPTSLIRKVENVPYQKPLNEYEWTPDSSMAPQQYEPGSVVFDGWYLNPECTGTEFEFDSTDPVHTMPAGTNEGDTTLTVYAKWVPVSLTVDFYLDKDEMESGVSSITDTHPQQTVGHGTVIGAVEEPSNGDYTFVGWFYEEDGVEKAFDFANMPVTKNLKVYGKWSSNVLKGYEVYFRIKTGEFDEDGNEIEIDVADPIKGSGLAGTTKTFDAKGGTELYAEYQEGYFPLVESHSIMLDIKGESTYTYTFYYQKKDAVPYTVYYVAETLKAEDVDKDFETIDYNGKTYYIIEKTETRKDNRKAVVTETFKPVTGYMPDAYQKRLVVTVDGDNTIYFFYTVDSEHAYYKITHYTQNTDGETWTEYATSQAQGTIGQTYTAEPMTISGFTYDSSVEGTVTEGELTENGLELKLYYVRIEYPYEVRYLEQGTGKVLADPKTGSGLYGKVISESAIPIANYTAVDPTSQTLTIKIEEDKTAKLNVITFYYTENDATINYKVVGPDGCGTVTPDSETVKVLTGTVNGSTAEASSSAYKFVGWYAEADCKTLLSTDAKYTPTKEEGAAWVDGTTYYAKFEPALGNLTISKSGLEKGDSAIFEVKIDGSVYTTVVLTGPSASVTLSGLTAGASYNVTEVGDWSVRYTLTSSNDSGAIQPGATVTASFNNTYTPGKWLDDEGAVKNVFTGAHSGN